MKKMICLLLLLPFLSGCSYFHVHKMDIEQGNIITDANVHRLHTGMSEAEVKKVMGNPLLITLFNDNEMVYVYTNQPGHHEMTMRKIRCIFRHGRLVSIEKEF